MSFPVAAGFVLFALTGCAGVAQESMMPAEAKALPTRPRAGNDNFWDAHAWSEERRPPPERPRSISLGYIGETPLEGGVTRESPMPARAARDPRAPMSWQDYVNAPNWTPQPHLPPNMSTPARRRGACLCDGQMYR